MFYKELKRLIFNIPVAAVILSALCISLILSYVMAHNITKDNENADKYYKEYISNLDGSMTKEKKSYIFNERQMIHDTVEKEQEMQASYDSGEISSDEYQNYLDDDFYAIEHYSAIERVKEQCESILTAKKRTGVQAVFVYDTYWNGYFDMNMITLLQMLIVMIIVIRFLSVDYISGIWLMTSSYRNGRTKMLNVKMGAVVLLCIGVSLIFSTAHFLLFYTGYDMPDINAPVQSLAIFKVFPIHFSIGSMVMFTVLWRAIALSVFGLMVFAITSFMKNLTLSFGVCGLITILPMLFGVTLKAARDISVYEYVLGVGIIKRSTAFLQMLEIFCVFTVAILGVYAINIFLQSDFRRKIKVQ